MIPRTKDLDIRWNGGKGKMSVIVSQYDPPTRTVKPILELRVKANNGKAVVPAKLLSTLPQQRYFVLTFILANRKEVTVTQPATGTILVQAAAVHNCYVEVR